MYHWYNLRKINILIHSCAAINTKYFIKMIYNFKQHTKVVLFISFPASMRTQTSKLQYPLTLNGLPIKVISISIRSRRKKFNGEKCPSTEMKMLAFWVSVHLVIFSDCMVNEAGLLTPIDVTFCTVLLFYSLVVIDSPGELGSAGRSLRQVRLLIEYSKDLTMAPLQGPELLCGCVKSL